MVGSYERVRRVIGVAFMVAGVVMVAVYKDRVGISSLKGLNVSDNERNEGKRELSIALPNGDCEITAAVTPQHQLEATFTASYPGSGAKMTWNLIEALTGFVTGDEWSLNGQENMVTVKSHYPHPQGRLFKNHDLIHRAILILRNPKNSIPSYYNFLYEVKNHLKGHSTRAPVEAWLAWRDVHFDEELQLWKKHTQYWLSRYPQDRRLLMTYEGLTDNIAGPIFTNELAEFLRKSRGVPVIDKEAVPCVWRTVIQYRGDSAAARAHQADQQNHRLLQESPPELSYDISEENNEQSLRTGDSFHPYTEDQIDKMLAVFRELREEFPEDFRLGQIMTAYSDALISVKEAMRTFVNGNN